MATTSTVHTTEEIFFVGLVGDSAAKAVITVTVGSSKPSRQVQFRWTMAASAMFSPLRRTAEQPGIAR